MDHNDFTDYQSSDTVWRYDFQVRDAEERIERLRNDLAKIMADLAWLKDHPPLYEYFNWSA